MEKIKETVEVVPSLKQDCIHFSLRFGEKII